MNLRSHKTRSFTIKKERKGVIVMRIGIPNRSSLLHIGAVAQCVTAGILSWSEYHPAKLFYRLSNDELWLCRCDDLCKYFFAGELDVIFTGDDYAGEYLRGIEYDSAPFAFIGVHFALLCLDPRQSHHFYRVFTKYPQTAKEHLTQWGVSYGEIRVLSGGCESFACRGPSNAAHDVICTGATQQVNELYAVHQGGVLGCSWYFHRSTFPEPLARVIANRDIFAKLQRHYQVVLHSRDIVISDTIGAILEITDQDKNK